MLLIMKGEVQVWAVAADPAEASSWRAAAADKRLALLSKLLECRQANCLTGADRLNAANLALL